MRTGASSGALVGTAFTFLAFGVGFLVLVLPIPVDVARGLTIVCFVAATIAFYGAYNAHYRGGDTAAVMSIPPEVPEFSTADARVCWVAEKNRGYAECETPPGPGDERSFRAVVVAFRNESSRTVATVRGEIHYVQTAEKIERVACATWLGEKRSSVVIAPRETKDLLVALYDGTSLFVVTDNRQVDASAADCARRRVLFRSFTAWIKLSCVDAAGALIGEFDERVGVAISGNQPTVEIVGPPGAIRGSEPHSIAEIDVICDEWSAVVEVKNLGESAVFSAALTLSGPVKTFRTRDIYCQWVHTPSVETRIAKGQTCRLRVADRLRDTGPAMLMGFSWWSIHTLVDGHPFDIESMYHSTPFSDPPAVAQDIVIDLDVIANPDLTNGIERHRIVLHAFKATVEPGLPVTTTA